MEKVRPWSGQPSDQGRPKNRTEENLGFIVHETDLSYIAYGNIIRLLSSCFDLDF